MTTPTVRWEEGEREEEGDGYRSIGGREALIDELYVRHRGAGVGTAALREMLAAAATAGAQRVFLETETHNTRVRSFYDRLGFRTDDSVWMSKGLTRHDAGVRAPPPEVIELPTVGARLRRHRVDDVDAVHEAIELSRDHLRPWMPWADQTRQDTGEFLERSVAEWDAGEDFGYLAIDDADGSVVGGTGLHNRIGEDGMEIGYWRRSDAGGRGLVTTWSAALTNAAFALEGIERVEIHCDEANVASAAVPRRIGFTLDRIEDKPIAAPGELGRSMIWICRAGQVRDPNDGEALSEVAKGKRASDAAERRRRAR